MEIMTDLISRGAAIDALGERPYNWTDSDSEIAEVCAWESHKSAIENVPAVDAVPVVHAHWIETMIPANTTGHGGVGQDKKEGILCSKCRCAFDVKLLWINDYCPHCGARMDGEANA